MKQLRNAEKHVEDPVAIQCANVSEFQLFHAGSIFNQFVVAFGAGFGLKCLPQVPDEAALESSLETLNEQLV